MASQNKSYPKVTVFALNCCSEMQPDRHEKRWTEGLRIPGWRINRQTRTPQSRDAGSLRGSLPAFEGMPRLIQVPLSALRASRLLGCCPSLSHTILLFKLQHILVTVMHSSS